MNLFSKNMARHLKLKHPRAFEELQNLRNKRHIDADIVIDRTEKIINTEKEISAKKTSIFTAKWVRNHCNKVGENSYQCQVCSQVLSAPYGTFSNIKRHFIKKHPEFETRNKIDEIIDEDDSSCNSDEFLVELKKEQLARRSLDRHKDADDNNPDKDPLNPAVSRTSEDEDTLEHEDVLATELNTDLVNISEDDPDLEEKVKSLCNKNVVGKKRATNPMWNFFNAIEVNRIYSCSVCDKTLYIFPHSFSNLKRHIRLKHPKLYKLIIKIGGEHSSRSSKPGSSKLFHRLKEQGTYKCNECDEVLICTGDNEQVLIDHAKEKHLDADTVLNYQSEDEEYNVVLVKKKDMEI